MKSKIEQDTYFESIRDTRIGQLTIIEQIKHPDKQTRWICQCKCGNRTERAARLNRLTDKSSCGCLTSKGTDYRSKIYKEYTVWKSMRQRCNDTKHKSYKDYGGRGIKVCDRWLNSFDNFIADMGFKPTVTSTIERLNVNSNYEPDNCIWLEAKYQGRNRRTNTLNNHKVKLIKTLINLNIKPRYIVSLLNIYNISKEHVKVIKAGKTWADVTAYTLANPEWNEIDNILNQHVIHR